MVDEKNISLLTPCYIYDEQTLHSRIDFVRDSLGVNCKLCYSMKANPVLLAYIKEYVDRIEVCSHGEFKICEILGIDPCQILYTGVNKQKEEISEAVRYGVKLFNVESLRHLELIREVAERERIKLKLFIRISSGNQFGMNVDDVISSINISNASEYLDIIGVHYYAGTSMSSKKRIKQLTFLREIISSVREKMQCDKIEIEYGPGLPVRCFLDEDKDLSEITMQELVDDLKIYMDNNDENWTIEMGRYLVADCGNYMTEVVDLKNNGEINFAIVDGGINHLNYYGQMMALRVPLVEFSARSDSPHYKYWICGSLCTAADVLVKDVDLPKLAIGDKLLFRNCGAYSNTESNYLFLSRDMPYVYLIRCNGDIKMMHNKQTTYDLNKEDGN